MLYKSFQKFKSGHHFLRGKGQWKVINLLLLVYSNICHLLPYYATSDGPLFIFDISVDSLGDSTEAETEDEDDCQDEEGN